MTHSSFLADLSEAEEAAVRQLEAEVEPLLQGSPSLQAFCTKACYVRYLRARSWNVHKASKMLQETLKWRQSYKPEQIRWEDIEHEARDGKMHVLEHPDKEGRPVVFMRPRCETSNNNETRLKYLVYTLEQASRLADDWAEDAKLVWLIDFVGYSRKNAPPVKVALATLHILQNHYPERLGKAVSYLPPTIFDLLYRAVSPFIDPVTRKKLVFVNKKEAAAGLLGDHFPLEGLDADMGGTLPADRFFDPARLEARYRLADAAVDRELLAATRGAEGSPAPSAAGTPTGNADPAARGLLLAESGSCSQLGGDGPEDGAEESSGEFEPPLSAGCSASSAHSRGASLGEGGEASGSVAEAFATRSGSPEGEAGEERGAGQEVEGLAVAVGALQVAAA